MDIDDIHLDKKLEADLGMDSQEILCLNINIEKEFGVNFLDGEIKRDFSLLDISCLIAIRQDDNLISDSFQGRITEGICINADAGSVYSALFNVSAWPSKLPHVIKVNIIYDDGFYQEFDMDVESDNGEIISVRSVRRCSPERISFFQPKPPRFLKHHCGEWFIQSITQDITHVTTIHRWNYLEICNEDVINGEDHIKIKDLLSKHAQFALLSWKKNLERVC
ncbi:hypothetical protein PT277_10395 [Acetobacteraceae bacterium ESL0709]|nr:hypothetical protein [Acetobacteraceae bacterium ESL0697]MDF7679083.1 hypothetical protein [Acetobacteraceae bacterium ESL0709]